MNTIHFKTGKALRVPENVANSIIDKITTGSKPFISVVDGSKHIVTINVIEILYID